MEITKGDWIHDHDGVFSEEKGLIGNVICESPESFGASMKNWDANAKLIAAAPDLLETLKCVCENLELQLSLRGCNTESAAPKSDADPVGGISLLRKAKEVIKKATE